MVAAAGEVVDQRVERLAAASASNDRHVVVKRDVSAIFAGAQARAVVRRIWIIFPATTICVELG